MTRYRNITIIFAILTAICICAMVAQAAPYIVSGPYPLESSLTDTDPPLPEGFIVVFDAGAPVTVPPTLDATGRVYLKYDLAPVAKGKHVVAVKAYHSVWGESESVPFAFRAGTPATPASVGLSKQ